jgi:hypothetical protein
MVVPEQELYYLKKAGQLSTLKLHQVSISFPVMETRLTNPEEGLAS